MNFINAYLGIGLLVSEIGLARWRRSAQTGDGRGMDANSLRLLWIVTLSAISLGVWLALSGIGPRLPRQEIWAWAGLAIFGMGTALRWWAIFHLGQFFTVDVSVAADHRVVDDGPYRLIRHPSYTGLLLQFAGLASALGNSLSLAVILVPITAALLYRIRVEESAMRNSLGETYASYMERTKRLVPWVL